MISVCIPVIMHVFSMLELQIDIPYRWKYYFKKNSNFLFLSTACFFKRSFYGKGVVILEEEKIYSSTPDNCELKRTFNLNLFLISVQLMQIPLKSYKPIDVYKMLRHKLQVQQ